MQSGCAMKDSSKQLTGGGSPVVALPPQLDLEMQTSSQQKRGCQVSSSAGSIGRMLRA
jgi:hypothetical protein